MDLGALCDALAGTPCDNVELLNKAGPVEYIGDLEHVFGSSVLYRDLQSLDKTRTIICTDPGRARFHDEMAMVQTYRPVALQIA